MVVVGGGATVVAAVAAVATVVGTVVVVVVGGGVAVATACPTPSCSKTYIQTCDHLCSNHISNLLPTL